MSDIHSMIELIVGPDSSKWPRLHIVGVDNFVEDFYFFLGPLALVSSLKTSWKMVHELKSKKVVMYLPVSHSEEIVCS